MPPLICCSPVILDQSFPRDTSELYLVADTLGIIQDQVNCDEIHLILTDELTELVENFDWNVREEYAILRDIYRLLDQWFLQQHKRLIRVDLSEIQEYNKHPIPEGCEAQGLVDLWSDEVGKLLVKHDKCCPRDEFFIGIACESAYCTGEPRCYINPSGYRVFPLVGPNEIPLLADAYDWQVHADIRRTRVYFKDVVRHFKVIGSESLIRPPRGSHYKLKFKGGRSWELDSNIDPVAEEHLRELTSITGYTLSVIKYALLNGELPNKILRFKTD
jgi:hypothetical protein